MALKAPDFSSLKNALKKSQNLKKSAKESFTRKNEFDRLSKKVDFFFVSCISCT